ncbi:hypothetical protein G647_02251 [Cladophialophora carrionii CBS 160.54]|uniref:Uncharacterized protein n=1 Tax=Cladophialophora carrionii CBS 160.54 TaxID=1279043 RepID=V9DGN7_9EURO|nr:uncharacterized protein G647_02251 [Cladophialophora carrionii CBS 160.54]ETI25478.1 hypothetical protein G647_02251 [Cladophialophora carrionii CBS 160.54]
MSEAELGPAVLGAVTALIAAYKNAGSIVDNIKEQRKARGAPPPSDELEEALQEGHWEIEKIQAQGVQRFGAAYEQGDDIAYRALRDLTIEVQSAFLTLAGKDDGTISFEPCIDSAIGARLRAVNILNDLYLRQQKRARSKSNTASDVSTSPRASQTKPLPDVLQPSFDDMKEVAEVSTAKPSIKRSATLESKSSDKPGSEKSSGSSRLSRKSSWGVFKILQRASSSDHTVETTSPTSPRTAGPVPHVVSPFLSPQSMPMSPSAGPMYGAPSPQIMTPPISPISTVSSIDVLAAAGFCKGAYYVQQGTLGKGLQLSAKNMQWTCHCRKCPFAIPAANEGGRPRFDDEAHSTAKLRWRSLLLFKSHLACSQRKKRLYKCLMCVMLRETSCTYDGEESLFEHMFLHQGGVLHGVELWGPLCFEQSGIRIGSETTFDICFAENPRFALPESAFEMGIATEIVEADGREIPR